MVGDVFVANTYSHTTANKTEITWKSSEYLIVKEIGERIQDHDTLYITFINEKGKSVRQPYDFVIMLIQNDKLIPVDKDADKAKLLLKHM
jgi:hypothetical protein